MGIYTMENEKMSVTIADHGAELVSLYDRKNQRELMWQADPAYWNRHAPILFPNVGKYYGGSFTYEGKEYPEGQHGFARDMDFKRVEGNGDLVKHRLVSSEETRARYPFDFQLDVTHLLNGNHLTVRWTVVNQGTRPCTLPSAGIRLFGCRFFRARSLKIIFCSLRRMWMSFPICCSIPAAARP